LADEKFAGDVLGVFYEKWFEDYVIGIPHRSLDKIVEGDRNEILKMIELLESKGMIWNDDGWFKIMSFGIETYEEALPPSISNRRITQRKQILECLKEVYDKDVNGNMDSKQIIQRLKIENESELRSQMKYLDDVGLVKYDSYMGGHFLAQLTAEGNSRFDSHDHDESIYMTSAYKILFKVENHLRRFIEKKLIEQYNDDWWDKGVSDRQRKIADGRKKEEGEFGWKISDTESNMDYLSFPHLSKIITTQWNIFEPIFKDTSKIELKLKELEEIRNAIAHTRKLSSDAMTRLEQYSDDIFNLAK